MTIAEQVAHDFLENIEKMITENKLDVGVLDTKVTYQSCEEAMMNVIDTKTGMTIATMTVNLNSERRNKERKLREYCNKRIKLKCAFCMFEEQEPCISIKIMNEEASGEEIDLCYNKLL